MKKHVYVQKPLTHIDLGSPRAAASIAREMGVVTQMGNQFTAYEPMRAGGVPHSRRASSAR